MTACEQEALTSKQKKKITELKKQKLLYNWDSLHFNKYKNEEISLRLPKGSNVDNLLTLNQFKELILKDVSLKELREKYNKHLVSFYSFFCQQDNIVSKEDLEKLYLKGFSLEECANEINIPKSYISYIRVLYGIERKGAKYIKRKNTEPELNNDQKQIIIGSLMGDAGRGGEDSIIKFKQCAAQKEYLLWKFNNLKNIVTDSGITIESKEDKRYNRINESYRFFTSANSFVEKCNKKLYSSGKKDVTLEYLEDLNPLGLAVWYMDDGTTDWSYLKKESTGQNITPEIKVCTDSFSLSSVNKIIAFLKEKFNIESHVRTHKEDMHRIIINTNSAYEFIKIIKPHVIPSMQYKVDYENYKKYREEKEIKLKKQDYKKDIIEDIIENIDEKTIESNLYDIYYPNKNFAINIITNEYDSEYSNTPIESRKISKVDCFPTNNANTFIRVFTLFEYDWNEKKSQLLNFIKSILGLNNKTAYARKCKITDCLDKDFYKEHHIQGYGMGTIACFNLEYDAEIIASISASRHHRQDRDSKVLVLNRLCFKADWNVPGGASRLFKRLKKWAEEEGYTSIISWSDNCWTDGAIYETLGFKLDDNLGPDYFYWDSNEDRYRSKQSQKKNSVDCPKNLTEREWALKRKLFRLWDRGKKRWTYELE